MAVSKKAASDTGEKPKKKRVRRPRKPKDAPFEHGLTEQEAVQKCLALMVPNGLKKSKIHVLSEDIIAYELDVDSVFYGVIQDGDIGKVQKEAICHDTKQRAAAHLYWLQIVKGHYVSMALHMEKKTAIFEYIDSVPYDDDQKMISLPSLNDVQLKIRPFIDCYGYPLLEQKTMMRPPTEDIIAFIADLLKEGISELQIAYQQAGMVVQTNPMLSATIAAENLSILYNQTPLNDKAESLDLDFDSYSFLYWVHDDGAFLRVEDQKLMDKHQVAVIGKYMHHE